MLTIILAALGILLVLTAFLFLSDNLIQIEAQKSGIDTETENFSIYPSIGSMFSAQAPKGVKPENFHALKQGHDIKLQGKALNEVSSITGSRYSLRPVNFRGIAPIPKLLVAVGDDIKAGDPIFYDKSNESIKYVAPVSGEVVEIIRGEKRAITDIVILADKDQRSRSFEIPNLKNDSRETIVNFLMSSGIWPMINQRPFDTIADPNIVPRDIFISSFDTAPLAGSSSHALSGRGDDFQKGLNVLNKLTDGKVYLSIQSGSTDNVLLEAMGVERHYFSGPHPAGNVGVQIHHIKPINSGESVWTLGVQEILTIGKLFNKGVYDASRVVAITGAELEHPHYIKTKIGASISELLKGNLKEGNNRIICGDVLSGKTSSVDSFLNFKDDQITVIKEGDQHELFGWLLPLKPRPSVSKTFPGFLMKSFEFEANTNTHGEKRAFVLTGGYEKLMPMDVHVMPLMKNILAGDIEKMEGLGILELSEEDVALAEFSDVSKQPLQKILRDGLDMIQEQG